jgi:two-component system response regulator ArlR
MENQNTVLTREQLISAVWGQGHYIDENSVDVYVRYIRQKIDEQAGEEYITTVRGFGYTMKGGPDQ